VESHWDEREEASVGRNDRNKDARQLLAHFFGQYEECGNRDFYLTPDADMLAELGWTQQQYLTAMERLVEKGLLEKVTMYDGCQLTEFGVDASEDPEELEHFFPVDPDDSVQMVVPRSPPQGAPSTPTSGAFEYEVALSFAGEDRRMRKLSPSF